MGGTIGRERQDAGAALNQGADLHLREMGANLREVARAFCLENAPVIPLAWFTKVH